MKKDAIMHAIQIRVIPDGLYARLKQASKMHHRSISGEMLSILEQALEKEYPAGGFHYCLRFKNHRVRCALSRISANARC